MQDTAMHVRRSRIWLYAPFGLLAILAIAWTVGWFVIRERTRSGLDEWIAGEAAAGRRWTCADRTISGYPFRIELGCASFTLDRPDVAAVMGRLLVVTQLHNPRHVIAELTGPLRVEANGMRGDGIWNSLRASVILGDSGFERISIVADGPSIQIGGGGFDSLDLASRTFEAHLRPELQRAGAYDLGLRMDGAILPNLDSFVGGQEPADIVASLVLTQFADLPARPLWGEMERWRLAGGQLDLANLSLTKGPRRLEAKGVFAIDDQRRPKGQLDASAAGLGGILGRLSGATDLGSLLGSMLGGAEPAPPRDAKAAPLRPLPQLRIANGRLYVGPLAIPGVRLQSLY